MPLLFLRLFNFKVTTHDILTRQMGYFPQIVSLSLLWDVVCMNVCRTVKWYGMAGVLHIEKLSNKTIPWRTAFSRVLNMPLYGLIAEVGRYMRV